ncbi:MAG: SpoIID/LytB domain-containing protein [Cyanobacteria bacterium M_surface_7_m2_040]|nr:SpoIID/LytB domain-containing protein [Cyanobacteria bacterium M_surface_7_m2_040]
MPLHRLPLRRALPLALLAQSLALPGWAQLVPAPRAVLGPLAINRVATEAGPDLRVLLQQDVQIRVEAIAQPLLLRGADGALLGSLPPGQPLLLGPDPATPAGLHRFDAAALASPGSLASGADSLGTELWIEPASADSLILVQQRRYRGRLQVRLQGDSLQVINHIALEAYLPSVVGSEMPASWPQPALRAQAVAARTYALRQRRPGEPFDLQATVASQVYKGVDSETESTREAVAATRGQVLTYGGALIEAVFHSSSGGSTEASGELWGQQLPYLVAVPDFDDDSPVRSWQERFEPDQLRQLFAETGGVQALAVIARSANGRVRELRIQGPLGAVTLTGAQLRKRLGLRSTWIELELVQPPALGQRWPADASLVAPVEPGGLPLVAPPPPLQPSQPPPLAGLLVRGRGYGHGIGMSQWGAYALARRGAAYPTILSHYYPGTQLDAFRDP